ncbi:MAG: hypothetical protein AB1752_07200 [Candidatus Zixiibacteriota bacterium]
MIPFSIPYVLQDMAAAVLVGVALAAVWRRLRRRRPPESCPACGGHEPPAENRSR